MNTDKAKRLLKKAQALFDNLSDQGSISSLERDLLLSYLRDLYDEVSNPTAPMKQTHEETAEPIFTKKEKPFVEEPAPVKPVWKEPVKQSEPEPVKPVWKEPVKEMEPEPVYPPLRQTTTIRQQEPAESFAEVRETVAPVQPKRESITQQSVKTDNELALSQLFEFKDSGNVAEKIKLHYIDRIEHGMGINERILTLNELFNNDNELFKKTLDHLNGLQSYNDARDYLIEGVANQFNWAEETRKHKATYFIELVRRRYVSR